MDSNAVGTIAPVTATPQTTARSPLPAQAGSSADVATRALKAQQNLDTPVQRDARTLQFQVESGRVITTIVDADNKTVVVQIPDAEIIRIAKSIDRMQGFLLDQKA